MFPKSLGYLEALFEKTLSLGSSMIQSYIGKFYMPVYYMRSV